MSGLKQRFRVRFTVPLLILTALLASGLNPPLIHSEAANKRILILHSYDSGLQWTDDQSDGFLEELRRSGIPFTASVEYLDWKHFPTGVNLERFTETIRYKYAHTTLDLVMVTDDTALEFAMEHRKDLLHDAPLVFSGVNSMSLPSLLSDTKNVAGIIEEVDPVGTVQAALTINPSVSDVHLLFDNSESGSSTGHLVMERLESQFPYLKLHPLNNLSYRQVLDHVRTLGKQDIVLMTTYFSDGLGQVVEFSEAAQAISLESTVPVYHLYDFALRNGAFGGSMTSGRLQGEAAAQLGIQLLKGAPVGSHSYMPARTIRKVFDYEQLKRFDIPVTRLPSDSEIINRPVTFYSTYKSLVWSTLGAFTVLIGFITVLIFYITRIRRMRISLARSEERFRLAANGSQAVIWDLDLECGRYFFSESWYELLGYEHGELNEVAGGWRSILHPEDSHRLEQEMSGHLSGRTPYFQCEYRFRCKNGDYKWFEGKGKGLSGPEGRYIRLAGSLIDITERKEYEIKLYNSYQELETTYEELTATQEELQDNYNTLVHSQAELHQLAYYDALSGMPNRVSLLAELDRFMDKEPDRSATILYVDIDHFKYINDTLGHTAGDQLIRYAADRLTSWTKDSDTVYRLSGDEFILFLKRGHDSESGIAAGLMEFFREPVRVNDIDLYISVSIGVARYPEDGRTAEELLKKADMAMYNAKSAGRGRVVEYHPSMTDTFNNRMVIETHLRFALKRQEFMVYYQPKVELRTGAVTGFEALIRWHNPALGFVSPLSFIQVAEDCRLIGPIGDWVLREACTFIREIQRRGYPDAVISVNLSVIQLIQEDFVQSVLAVLEETGLPPQCLELEITESIFMESYENAIGKLRILHGKGVRIALDDFGTGYSSLSYLMQLPITTLKIDKSFIDQVPGRNGEKTLTEAIITIGHQIGLEVVAEGVEMQEQMEYLRLNSCDTIQGYLISKPLPEREVFTFLDRYAANP
ncbi:EAL domain-containing protein [Gorillibacterium sp. sgz5001074]|uniref:EAL domain-containing protein n=1 Tax=Gorillibacterium sp. sgz5001074 TaxID=3446695 RepID=UPI003F67F744